MVTKPQDIIVALKLAIEKEVPTYAELGVDLGMSASEVHAAVRRLIDARLVEADSRVVRRDSLKNFIVNGVPHAFPASPRELTRGMPTAWAAPVFFGKIADSEQIQPVWPDPEGSVRGAAVQPLYSSVTHAASSDRELYDLLALVDALRFGRAREREIAEIELGIRLAVHAPV